MYGPNSHKRRLATQADAGALRRLAALDSRAPLTGRVLVGDIDGAIAAALSLEDGRVIADPFKRTDHLVACLRMDAHALRAYEETPSLRDRVRAAVTVRKAPVVDAA